MDLLPDVREAIAPFVEDSGVCPEDIRTLKAINNARRILYPMGDWEGTTDDLCVKCYAGHITLPAEYEYAKQANHCRVPITVENDWFSRMDTTHGYCGPSWGGLVKENGQYVTFRDWPGCIPGQKSCCAPEGFTLAIAYEDTRDCGMEISFEGIGAARRKVSLTRILNGQPFRTCPAKPGEGRMVELKHVIKPKTNGRIRVFGTDGANTILLALYDPDDINPHYTRYFNIGSRALTFGSPTVLIKAKKRFIAYEDNPQQFVDIHTEALIMMAQALTARKNKDTALFSQNVTLAAAFLQKQLGGPQSTSTSPIKFSQSMRVTGLIE